MCHQVYLFSPSPFPVLVVPPRVYLGASAVHELLLSRLKQQLWEVAVDTLQGEVQDMMGLLPRKSQVVANATAGGGAATAAVPVAAAGGGGGGGGVANQTAPPIPAAAAGGGGGRLGELGRSLATAATGSGAGALSGSSSAATTATGTAAGAVAAAAAVAAVAHPLQDPRQRLYAALSMLLLNKVVANNTNNNNNSIDAMAVAAPPGAVAAGAAGAVQGYDQGGRNASGEGLWGEETGGFGRWGLDPFLLSLRALVLQHVQKSQALQHLAGEGVAGAAGVGVGVGGGSGGGSNAGGRGGNWLADTLIGALVMQLLHSSVQGVLRQEVDRVLAKPQEQQGREQGPEGEEKVVVPLTVLPHQQSGYCSAVQLLPARRRGVVTSGGGGVTRGVTSGGGAASVAWGGPGWGGGDALLVVTEREVAMEGVAAALGEGG